MMKLNRHKWIKVCEGANIDDSFLIMYYEYNTARTLGMSGFGRKPREDVLYRYMFLAVSIITTRRTYSLTLFQRVMSSEKVFEHCGASV